MLVPQTRPSTCNHGRHRLKCDCLGSGAGGAQQRPYDLCRASGGDVDRGCGVIRNVSAGMATAVCAEHAEIIEIAEKHSRPRRGKPGFQHPPGGRKSRRSLAKCASRSRRRGAPSTLRSKPDRYAGRTEAEAAGPTDKATCSAITDLADDGMAHPLARPRISAWCKLPGARG
jgi:hypothetical protein